MPEEIEVETKDLQETIEELHHERQEREESERKAAWTRYIALTTAILAVFAAIGALQSGNLVNRALIYQLQASDKWNEYQAARQKQHLYMTVAYSLLDAGATPPVEKPKASESVKKQPAEHKPAHEGKHSDKKGGKAEGHAKKSDAPVWKPAGKSERLAQYLSQYDHEESKRQQLQEDAKKLEEDSEKEMHLHHEFANSVALIQVAIALSAVAALTRIKWIWLVGTAAGLIGIVLFTMGFLPH